MRAGLMSLAMCSLMFVAGPAHGETSDPGDILGSWTFKTAPYRNGQCIMSGSMHLGESAISGRYTCELTATEICSMWGKSIVLQSCDASRFGNQLSIRSKIEQYIERKEQGLVYIPDNFTLTIKDAALMMGALVSAVTAPVEFRRSVEGMS